MLEVHRNFFIGALIKFTAKVCYSLTCQFFSAGKFVLEFGQNLRIHQPLDHLQVKIHARSVLHQFLLIFVENDHEYFLSTVVFDINHLLYESFPPLIKRHISFICILDQLIRLLMSFFHICFFRIQTKLNFYFFNNYLININGINNILIFAGMAFHIIFSNF